MNHCYREDTLEEIPVGKRGPALRKGVLSPSYRGRPGSPYRAASGSHNGSPGWTAEPASCPYPDTLEHTKERHVYGSILPEQEVLSLFCLFFVLSEAPPLCLSGLSLVNWCQFVRMARVTLTKLSWTLNEIKKIKNSYIYTTIPEADSR